MSCVLLLHKHYIAVLVSPTPFLTRKKTAKCVIFSIFDLSNPDERSLSPACVRGGGAVYTHALLHAATHTHGGDGGENAFRGVVQLYPSRSFPKVQ